MCSGKTHMDALLCVYYWINVTSVCWPIHSFRRKLAQDQNFALFKKKNGILWDLPQESLSFLSGIDKPLTGQEHRHPLEILKFQVCYRKFYTGSTSSLIIMVWQNEDSELLSPVFLSPTRSCSTWIWKQKGGEKPSCELNHQISICRIRVVLCLHVGWKINCKADSARVIVDMFLHFPNFLEVMLLSRKNLPPTDTYSLLK